MTLIIIFMLVIPLLLFIVITYLSSPAKRGFWMGCTLVIFSLIVFIAARALYYDMYHRPRVGVLGSRLIEPTFWESQSRSIIIAIYAFVQGLLLVIIGWKKAFRSKRKSVIQSASKSR